MSLLLEGTFEPVTACWRWEPLSQGRVLVLDSVTTARQFLARFAGRPDDRLRLRRLVSERLAASEHLEDGDVLDRLARWIASGELRIVVRERGALSSWGDAQPAEEARPEDVRAAVTERTWVTIQLVGEDERPIPGARYRVELPDASVREGQLDGQGLARFRNIDPGSCVVTFPDLDQEAWAPLRTTPEP